MVGFLKVASGGSFGLPRKAKACEVVRARSPPASDESHARPTQLPTARTGRNLPSRNADFETISPADDATWSTANMSKFGTLVMVRILS